MKNFTAKPLGLYLPHASTSAKLAVVLGLLFVTPLCHAAMFCTSDPASLPCPNPDSAIFGAAHGFDDWHSKGERSQAASIDRRDRDESDGHSEYRSRNTYYLSDWAGGYLGSVEESPGSISRDGQHYWASSHHEIALHRSSSRHHRWPKSPKPPRGNHFSPNEEPPATIPLPAPLGLLAAGAIALFAAARRRR